MTAVAPNVTFQNNSVQRVGECVCNRKGFGREILSFFDREKNASQKPSADYPSYLIGQDWVPCHPNKKTKGDKLATADLYPSEFTPWAWHIVPYHPKLGSIGKEKGD